MGTSGGEWGEVLLSAQFLDYCLFFTAGQKVTEAALGPAAVTTEKGVCPAGMPTCLAIASLLAWGMCRPH